MFSARSRFVREPNALAMALATRRAAGREILDLTLSNPTEAALVYDERTVLALAKREALVYEPAPFGLVSARRAVRDELEGDGIELDPERVVLTASTSEAYSFAFKLLCDPGDELLVPEPSYPLLEHLAALECVELRPYRLGYDGAWHIDFASVRAAASARSRGIVLVSPNNPTGSFLKRHELGALSELGLPVISDEVFARYSFRDDPSRAKSALELAGVLVVALGGLSKLAALPQHKLAWMLFGGPETDVREALARLELIADTYLSVSAAVQHALVELFAASRKTRQSIVERTRENLERLRALLAGSATSVLDVEGGWYAVLRLPRVVSEEEWVLSLLEDAAVLVQPGWFFDFADEPFAIVSLLTPEAVFSEGIRRLAAHVAFHAP